MRRVWREYLTKRNWIQKIPLPAHHSAAFLTKNWSGLKAIAPASVSTVYPLSPRLLPQLIADQLLRVDSAQQLLLVKDPRQQVVPWAAADEELLELATHRRYRQCELGYLKLVDAKSGEEEMRSELLRGDSLRLLDFRQLWSCCRRLLERAGSNSGHHRTLLLHHLHPAPELLMVVPNSHLYFLSALSQADCQTAQLLATHLDQSVSVRAVGLSQWSYQANFSPMSAKV